ncbi:uncharacterized protein LOC129612067 [Condylostylus longicornis]|uniref:uncharacterized protein LOC129612067 n=1 Tax=Condylostylus longicornis TaxID=2530218 RepID=UPI00244DE57E|nr:uncharacterized protein LOC129612067 [Condylostylus longicornis]
MLKGVIAIITILITINKLVHSQETDYNYHYDKLEITDLAKAFSQNITVNKLDDETFEINGFVEQHADLIDNEWQTEIILYKRDDDVEQKTNEEEKVENYKELYRSRKIGACEFMQTFYKKYLYETLSKYSNAPHYSECPFKAKVYNVTNYPFKVKRFGRFVKPGYYRLDGVLNKKDGLAAIYSIHFHIDNRT